MKGEKFKLILVYILMVLVIVLIVALTFVVLNNKPKETNNESHANTTPTVNLNPYPTVSDECTFETTFSVYNSLTSPGCKGGYSRYNITDITLDNNNIETVIIYSDTDGNKSGLYINKTRVISKVDNLTNIKFGIFDSKLFILDNSNNESNVLAYNSNGNNVYNLKDTLENLQISEPAFQNADTNIISASTLNPNGFTFEANRFIFKTRLITTSNQTIEGSQYVVNFNGDNFEDPVLTTNIQNQG